MTEGTKIQRKKVKKYINDVLSGRRICGKLERLAVERHLADLENADKLKIRFDEVAAMRCISFFSILKHSKGEFSGKRFELEPWQMFIVWVLFGWKRLDGSRRFRYAYVEVARKNGKTTFAAALSLYMMVLDGEDGAEIYTAATKRDQAKICWTEARNMVGKSPALSNKIARFQSALTMESTLSKMEPLAADSDKLDGLNPHFAVVDEYHAHKTDMLYNVLKSATGARRQPMIFTITTAGFDKTSPCFLMRRIYIDVLLGIKKQENTFVMIYSADEGDDWKDPKTWAKSNPNMGISISAEYLEEEFKSALNRGGSEEVNFKTKNLNQWVDAPTVWIQDEKVRKCSNGTTDADLVGQTCYAGLDLASHVDINALALYFPELKAIKLYYWIPEAKMEENADRVDYKTWAAEGRIFVTEGNVIDIDAQVEKITEIIRGVNCRNIAYDPAKAYHGTVQGLQKAGLNNILDEFNQSIKTMSEPTRELQRLVESAEVDLMNDPVLRWMFRNAVAVTDANDNIKLHKAKSMNKIDGLTAIINAIGGYMSGAKPEPYKDSDLKILNF
ncbi:MAG TPA: terminase large subunit [Smithellaceae bacterium]|jgi:phage terminase large subunit-like protein|nr:terminase large subunit [Smithellaceae bacterium]HPM21610.1 terminase large subunit [Thermotogota bacterium]